MTHPELWDAVCSWVGLATDPRQVSASTAANLRRLVALYVKADEVPERVQADAEAWWRDDWRGKQGQAPSVAQGQDWRARCRRNGHAPPGRGTEAAAWRKDKPADPRYVRAPHVARIAGDAKGLPGLTRQQTRIDLGIRKGHEELTGARHNPVNEAVMIVLTDGLANPEPPSTAVQRAAEAKRVGIKIFAIGLGTGAEVNVPELQQMATYPGYFYLAPDGEDLVTIYGTIAVEIPCPAAAFWARR